MYGSVALSVLTLLYNHHQHQSLELFYPPKHQSAFVLTKWQLPILHPHPSESFSLLSNQYLFPFSGRLNTNLKLRELQDGWNEARKLNYTRNTQSHPGFDDNIHFSKSANIDVLMIKPLHRWKVGETPGQVYTYR